VSLSRAGPRPRPLTDRAGALCVALALGALALVGTPWTGSLGAQVPDTVPPPRTDTIPPVERRPDPAPPADTVPPTDTVPPEPEPAPVIAPMAPVGPSGWAAGVWEWSRADLMRLPDVSLLHLLQRIPGFTPVRATSVGQPEAASVFGATTGAITYEVDGFVLDPLTRATFDPSRVPLLALEHVRVERRVTGATVRLRTTAPAGPEPVSRIEAGTGDLRTNLFRGTFLAPRVFGGGLGLGFESLGSQALPGGDSNHTAVWLKWTWARDDAGIQLEYRHSDMSRSGVGAGLSGMRREWLVRARHRFGVVTGEVYAGNTAVKDELGELVLREGTPQGGVRVHAAVPSVLGLEATTALRLRSHPRLPSQELDVSLWLHPVAWIGVGGELVHGRWADGSPTGRREVRAVAGPLLGLTLHAGLFQLDEAILPVPLVLALEPDDPEFPAFGPLEQTRSGARLGAQLQFGRLLVGGAAIRAAADSVPGFGLPYDATAPRFGGGEATGMEITAQIPTFWAPLRMEGWYVEMEPPAEWLYLPARQWRAGIVYHHLPLPSGNLELYLRAEHHVRGPMTVVSGDDPVRVGAYRAANLEVSIRVLTVHAFFRWDNLMNRPFQQDVPGFNRPGQHVLYGIKWQFLN
jgi:hypothetical protein